MSDVPRLLTPSEIESIVQRIPDVKAATIEASITATSEIRSKFRLQLVEKKVCPSKIKSLGDHIVNAFYRSRSEPGDPVGITASEGIGGPATQMTLSGFHNAGSSKNVGSGLDIIRELLNVSPKRKVESTVIHFRNKNLTFEEVLEYRRDLIGVTIKDLLSSSPTLHGVRDQKGYRVPYSKRGWWYPAFLTIMGMKSSSLGADDSAVAPDEEGRVPLAEWESYYYLRLKINKTRMFSHRLTPQDIIRTLESGLSCRCIASPSIAKQCIIDLYPGQEYSNKALSSLFKDETSGKIDQFSESLLFLKIVLIPALDQYFIKGIRGITQIFPQSIPTISIIRSYESLDSSSPRVTPKDPVDVPDYENSGEPSVTEGGKETRYRIWIDQIKFRINGIPISKLYALFEACGMIVERNPSIHDLNEDYYSIEPPPRRSLQHEPPFFFVTVPASLSGKKPNEIINDRLAIEKKNEDENVRIRKQRVLVVSVISNVTTSSPNVFQLTFDTDRMAKLKITEEELEKTLSLAGIHRRSHGKDLHRGSNLSHGGDEDWSAPVTTPSQFLRLIEQVIPPTDRYAFPQTTHLQKLGSYVYAETNGSNLQETLSHPLVDNRRSISNNPNDIYSTISLQAAYSFITKDFYDTIVNNSAYCSPRHITTLVSFMTNIALMSVTARGVSRQNRGSFSDASFEHAIDAFIKSATSGSWESADATSTSIFFGNRGKFGTGAFGMGLDKEALTEIRRVASMKQTYNLDFLEGLDPETLTFVPFGGEVDDFAGWVGIKRVPPILPFEGVKIPSKLRGLF
jgi:hypothetical protein